MPWKEVSRMESRKEFVLLALNEAEKMRKLCRHFGISPTTGYKWLKRYQQRGENGLFDQSCRPHTTPTRTSSYMEKAVLEVRRKHHAWGGRTINKRLKMLGITDPPHPSTITKILHRHRAIEQKERQKHKTCRRFEREEPNQLWQMDFKGHFQIGHSMCHPLGIIDDCSRFLVGLKACPNQKHDTIQPILISVFRRYGLPYQMLMDNGAPWRGNEYQPYSLLTVWLIRLGISVIHGRPWHPQTQGKAERFNGTMQIELLQNRIFRDFMDCQDRFDEFQHTYNFERPHQSLEMNTPGSIYHTSPHEYPEVLPPIEYGVNDKVLTPDLNGNIWLQKQVWHIGKAFRKQPVAIRPTATDGMYYVFYCHQKIVEINLKEKK